MPSDIPTEPAQDRRRAAFAAHPLFPAILALWLAALLAIGAMIMPVGLIERAAGAVHLDDLVPSARPPLGFTARLLLAFALALTGAAGGLLAARALGRRHAGSPVRQPAAAVRAAPTPTAGDDEDFARLAASRSESTPRRRALTSETAEGAPSILEISALPTLAPLAAASAAAEPAAEPADAPADAPAGAPSGSGATPAAEPADDRGDAPAIRFRSPAQLAGTAAMRLCAAPLETLGVIELVERFAVALHARRHRDGTTEPSAPASNQIQPTPFGEPHGGAPRPAPSANRPFDMPAEPCAEDLASRPADQNASPLLARRPAPPANLAPSPAGEMVILSPPVQADRWLDENPGSDSTEPALWSLPELDGGDDHGGGDGSPADPAADPDATGYSSLLDLRPTTRVPPPLADFVRIEDGEAEPAAEAGPRPVVVFPGQAVPAPPLPTRLPGMDEPASAAQTEAALREALAALQRMSGTA
ncbi:hypothetical protein ACFOD9_13190 [Novosphingobium bradum]|uniref:Uncharacterized protein n=1 Tax=Novosphingobium bradum TaxID=1737444 RepID=A0ABV7ISA4_9SPHN